MFKKEVIREEGEPVLFKLNTILQIPLIQIPEDKTKVNITYQLIDPFVSVRIYWDENLKEVIYKIQEPELDENERTVLGLIEEGIKELINISLVNIKDQNVVIEYLEKSARILLTELRIRISVDSFIKIMYYIYRDFIGLNDLEPLMRDPFIEDIECNGIGTPVYIVHRKLRNLKTNLTFTSIPYLANLVEKIAQRCGKYVSYANPLLDGSLPDGSRANATYTQDISTKGPTITIRKFTKDPWTPTKLMKNKTVSPEMLAYLWLLLENESNIMVIGGTGSGKTSLLNSIAFFIPPPARIVSIEDTHELQLMHENWLPSVSREATSGFGGAARQGEVSLFDLLKESFRQRPDYVIVGEIRGSEAYVLFQGMASIKGNEKVMVLNSENPKDIPIENMKSNIKYKAFCIDIDKNKVGIVPVKSIIKHPNRSSLLNIKTKSGREVTITEDHSLFTYDNGAIPIRGNELKIGDTIIIPSRIPCGYADLDCINLIEFLPNIRIFAPSYVRKAVNTLGYDNACKIIGLKAVSDYYANFTRSKQSSLTSDKFLRLMGEADISYNLDEINVKFLKKSKSYPPKLKITKELLKLLGYYLSDGTMNNSGRNSSMALYNKNKKILKDMRQCIKTVVDDKIRERVTDRGFGSATELSFSHKVLFEFIKEYCGKGAKNKKIPDFIFGLNKDKIGYFLTGLYNGDGWITRNQIGYSSISKELIDGVTKLLLVYGIVGRISEYKQKNRKNTNYRVIFYKTENMKEFLKYVKLTKKKVKLRVVGRPDPYRKGDIYLDKIKDIKKIVLTKPEPVYDISVPGIRNFIGGFGGILLHNSGHSCMGTMHAEDVVTMIRRLETQPINLSPTLVDSLDAVCVMSQVKLKGEPARKLTAIVEIISVSEEKGKATTNTAFVWNPANDKFMFKTDLKVFDKIIQQRGITKDQLIKEFQTRVKLLIEMYKRNILEIADVHGIINEYYKNPQGVLKRLNIT